MREEEIMIRYRMPSIPGYVDAAEKEMREEAQRNFASQILAMVMEYMDKNGVELMAARKRTGIELFMENPSIQNNRGASVPSFMRMKQ